MVLCSPKKQMDTIQISLPQLATMELMDMYIIAI